MANKSPKTAITPKQKAWRAMSQYVRVKACLESTGLAFVGRCFTCQRQYHINFLEAGHCFGGRRNARLFDVLIIKAQCGFCNRAKNGEPVKFKKRLIEIHGKKWVENRKVRGLRDIKDNQIDYVKLQQGIERMRDKLFREFGYKTFGEILQEGKRE